MTEPVDQLQKVYLSHTDREWKTIQKRLADLGRKNLSSYVIGSIRILEKQYSNDKNGTVKNVPRRFQKPLMIPESYLKILGVISLKTGVPVATLIDRFIIEPLMMPLD